jgi:L-xylulokinase
MGEYLLGIDNGGTVSKAAVFTVDGVEIGTAGRRAELHYPKPGWTERDLDLLWGSTAEAIRAAIAAAGIRPEEIAGIGACGHGNGIYMLDQSGQPVWPGIASMDTRAAGIVDEWNRAGIHDAAFPMVLQSFWAAQPPPLLAWFKRQRPDVYARIGHILLCKDYIKFRLTGSYSTDYGDISASSLLDSPNGRYSRELLDLYDIAEVRDALPQPLQSHDLAGRVTPEAAAQTGLAAGTPVVGGLFDVDAAALGSGVISEGVICIVSGTWSINEVVTDHPVIDKRVFMSTLYTVPGLWMTIEASATSASNLEWFVEQFCAEEKAEAAARGISVYEVCNEKVSALPPGSTDILFHPFLFGSNVQASARAGFYGVAAWHTRAHLLRALYEGVVYGHMNHIAKLRDAGAHPALARFTGGGSRSRVWSQMFADALQLPVEVAEGKEVAARGAAIAAGIAAGIYADHADAVARTVRLERRHEPDPTVAPFYLARYAEYECLLDAMREPWDRLAKLSE